MEAKINIMRRLNKQLLVLPILSLITIILNKQALHLLYLETTPHQCMAIAPGTIVVHTRQECMVEVACTGAAEACMVVECMAEACMEVECTAEVWAAWAKAACWGIPNPNLKN